MEDIFFLLLKKQKICPKLQTIACMYNAHCALQIIDCDKKVCVAHHWN